MLSLLFLSLVRSKELTFGCLVFSKKELKKQRKKERKKASQKNSQAKVTGDFESVRKVILSFG